MERWNYDSQYHRYSKRSIYSLQCDQCRLASRLEAIKNIMVALTICATLLPLAVGTLLWFFIAYIALVVAIFLSFFLVRSDSFRLKIIEQILNEHAKDEMSCVQTMQNTEILFEKVMCDRDTVYLLCAPGFGDFILVGALAYKVRERKKKQKVALIAAEKLKRTGISFTDIDDIILLPEYKINQMMKYVCHYGVYETDNFFYAHFYRDEYGWRISETKNFLYRYKHDVFHVPDDTKLHLPVLEEIAQSRLDEIVNEFGLAPEKSVILTPYANTLELLPMQVWRKVAEALQRQGYQVFTSFGPQEEAVPGTVPMSVPVSELTALGKYIRCIVGLRSGLMDVLALSEAKLVCIMYPGTEAFDLTKIFPEHPTHTIYHDQKKDKEEQLVARVLDAVDHI